MADVKKKLELLKQLRDSSTNPDTISKTLPIIDHAWKTFPKRDDGEEWYDDPQYNLGWDAGMLPDSRPYFLECWATCGITMLTYFISTKGIEDASEDDLLGMLEDAKLVHIIDPDNRRTQAVKVSDDTGNEFWSINITVGDEEGTYTTGGRSYPFRYLNEFNKKKS